MPNIHRLEARFGHFAIPSLVQFIAGLQLVTLILLYFMPNEGKIAFLENLILIREKVFQGQVWRLFTYMFIPTNFSPLWALIAAWFMMFIGRGLDQAWGAFRVNLFVFGGVAAVTLGGLIFGFSTGGMWFFQTLIFAFAIFYPNEEIMLFFILPVKIKWIAWIAAGMMAFTMVSSPSQILPIFFANIAFAIAFGPEFIRNRLHAAKVQSRRQRFEAAQIPAEDAFHRCVACGKTEHDDRHLEWRVAEDGEEYCSECRSMK
jgi:hypothetical protein